MNERDPALTARDGTSPFTTRGPALLYLWWRREVVDSVDHRAVIQRVHEDAGWNAHFAFMTLMSAGISILGLLLGSPAVIIGAMLISPLMGPIIGVGFAAATFDSIELRRSVLAVAVGAAVAILFTAFIVLLSPLQSVTPEIAARTRPNLFDLMVALFSGLAGTYATIRGRHGTIVGVAIATALMPPLAVVGFGLATLNWPAFFGALILFFTNLMTIALATAVLARLYNFGHRLSPRQTGLQATVIVVIFIGLALPLGFALRQIAWETVSSIQAREVIGAQFGGQARLSQIEVRYDTDPITVEAIVLTPVYQQGAEVESERILAALLRRPVSVNIEQFRVGLADDTAAQAAAARGATADRAAARIVEKLALIAGVASENILVDRGTSRAMVRAAPLPGAPLASYRALEERVAAAEPRWTVTLIPPAAALPEVAMAGAALDEGAGEAINTAAWGAGRLGLPIGVTAARADQAETVIEALRAAGVEARAVPGTAEPGAARLSWAAPGVD